jgi:short-subunit dehydrogenase involved in D-alanine esterification of teichoic acids
MFREQFPVLSEGLPHQPLDPVPTYCVSRLPLHTDSQSIPWQSIR